MFHVEQMSVGGERFSPRPAPGAQRRSTWNSVPREPVGGGCLTTAPLKRASLDGRGSLSQLLTEASPMTAPSLRRGIPRGMCQAPPSAQCESLSRTRAHLIYPDHLGRCVQISASTAHGTSLSGQRWLTFAGTRSGGEVRGGPRGTLARVLVFAEGLAERGRLRSREPASTGAAGAARRWGNTRRTTASRL